MANVLVWADIPVKDFDRAKAFYTKLLGTEVAGIPGQSGVGLLMPPGEGSPDDASADIAMNTGTEPSTTHGPVIYLSANGDIDGMIERAVAAGGKVLAAKQDFGEMGGWLAKIVDTEGNLIGLQQPSS